MAAPRNLLPATERRFHFSGQAVRVSPLARFYDASGGSPGLRKRVRDSALGNLNNDPPHHAATPGLSRCPNPEPKTGRIPWRYTSPQISRPLRMGTAWSAMSLFREGRLCQPSLAKDDNRTAFLRTGERVIKQSPLVVVASSH